VRRSYLALAVLTAACASAGASDKSGVAPKSFDKPPFYAGAKVPNVASVGYLPIRYQADRSDPKGDAGSPAATLVTEMNAYLDSIATFAKLLPNVTEVGTAPASTSYAARSPVASATEMRMPTIACCSGSGVRRRTGSTGSARL